MSDTIETASSKPYVGDFVDARLLGSDERQQGVVINIVDDKILMVLNRFGLYLCEENPTVFLDSELPDSLKPTPTRSGSSWVCCPRPYWSFA